LARQSSKDPLGQHGSLELGKYANIENIALPDGVDVSRPADAGTGRRSSNAVRVADPEDREVIDRGDHPPGRLVCGLHQRPLWHDLAT
jgi:hypothetical protein